MTKLLGLTKTGLVSVLCAQLGFATTAATMAQADMLGTEAVINKYAGHSDRNQLEDALQRDDIRAEIIALGVDPAEVDARLDALSDAEVASILVQMERDNAGADIVGTLFTVFVILLVTDVLCLTRFFNFTRCVR